jgi:hypothetical protein
VTESKTDQDLPPTVATLELASGGGLLLRHAVPHRAQPRPGVHQHHRAPKQLTANIAHIDAGHSARAPDAMRRP